MLESLLETLPEVLELALLSLGSAVLTLTGAYLDFQALESFLAGEAGTAPAFLYFGTLALFAGSYMLGYRELLPRLRQFAHQR